MCHQLRVLDILIFLPAVGNTPKILSHLHQKTCYSTTLFFHQTATSSLKLVEVNGKSIRNLALAPLWI